MRGKFLILSVFIPKIFLLPVESSVKLNVQDVEFANLFRQKSEFMEFNDLDKPKSQKNAYETSVTNDSKKSANIALETEGHVSKLTQAKKLYEEQEQEKAVKLFLESLEPEMKHSLYIPSAEEQELYQKALKIYLEAKGDKLHQGSIRLVSTFAPIIKNHPEYCQLTFIVAAAYANQGNYLRYFDLFHHAYSQNPNHYLAHKMQAVLWIKLFEKEIPGLVKEQYRKKILKHLSLASAIYPKDTCLYKLMIFYASDKKRPQIILEALNKIIQGDILIPRGDLEFYVQQALSIDDLVTTQKFVDKAGEWYHFSKVVKAANEYIKNRIEDQKNE